MENHLFSLKAFQTFEPYFSYDQNNQLCVHYGQNFEQFMPLVDIVNNALEQGAKKPCVLTFRHITEDRMLKLYQSFNKVMRNYRYQGHYQLAYPIKVNPNANVMQTLKNCAHKHDLPFSFEVGSKSELLSVLAISSKQNSIICNGFKDLEFYRLGNLAAKLGFKVVMVLEHVSEVTLVKALAQEDHVYVDLGFRTKPFIDDLHSIKFGLSLVDILSAKNEIKALNLAHKVVLLHGHIGSQLKNLKQVEKHINMMVCLYAELLKECVNLNLIDLGGGLGIDYLNTQKPHFEFDYYAQTVVRTFSYYVDLFDLPHPNLITESGRAMTAMSSVLIVSPLYQTLCFDSVAQTSYDKATQDQWLRGDIDLNTLLGSSNLSYIDQTNQYKLWLNFSLFQSLPDHWGINQHFPLLPVRHYSATETIDCQIFDISCDADGVIKGKDGMDYISLPMTEIGDLAFMFVGSYQDMLSSKHNIIGKTSRVEINFNMYDECVISVEAAEDYHALLCQYGHNPLSLLSKFQRLSQYNAQTELTTNDLTLLDNMLNGFPYLQFTTYEESVNAKIFAS